MTPFIDNTINLTDLMYLAEDATIDYNHIIQLPPEVLKRMRDELNKEDVDIMEKAQGKQMYNIYARGMSTQGRDHADAIIKSWLEEYDKEMDEAILASDNIVKAYNDFISGEFDRLAKSDSVAGPVSKYNSALSNIGTAVTTTMGIMKECGYSYDEAKKMVIGRIFTETDDPEKIKKIIKARLEYNKVTIQLLQAMVKSNAKLLNLSETQVKMLTTSMESDDNNTRNLAVKMSKEAIAKEMSENKDKYFKNGYYDYTPLGMGKLYLTEENLGPVLEEQFRDNRGQFIQKLMHYDAVILGHGDYSNEARDRDLKEFDAWAKKEGAKLGEMYQKSREVTEEYYRKYNKYYDLRNDRKKKLDQQMDSTYAARRAVIKSINHKLKKDQKLIARAESQIKKDVKSGKITEDDGRKRYAELEKKAAAVADIAEKQTKRIENDDSFSFDKMYDAYRNSAGSGAGVNRDAIEKKLEITKQNYDNELDDYRKKLNKTIAEFQIADADSQDVSRKWTIQPIKTESGTYTDVNDLVRALYKAGHRKIFMMQCNPGGVPLAPDIRKHDDLHIVMSKTVTLAESVEGPEVLDEFLAESDTFGVFSEASYALVDADCDLINMCEAVGIDYFDDEYLDECYRDTTRPDFFDNYSLNEGLGNVWHKIVEIVKKVIGAIVGLFKKMIGMVVRFIKWVAGKFKKAGGKLTSKIKIKMALIENAKTIEKEATSPADIAAIATEASNKIAKKIKEAEKQQTANMELYHKYATKKASSTGNDPESKNESIITLQDMLNM